MFDNRPELLLKLNSLINRYGGDKEFTAHVDEWPRTIKDLIYSSKRLMLRFGLICLIPDYNEDEFIGME